MGAPAVRAAGVVLTRGSGPGLQTLVLYRPLRRDWSLPKGKLDPGEHIIECAVRECDEETGIVPVLGVPLGRQRYEAMGRAKTVDYWHARPSQHNGFVPDDEVSEIRWVGIDEARALLTYRRDIEFVERAQDLPETSPLIVLRHGAAVSRSDYSGEDDTRPLAGKGRSQARALAPLLEAYGVAEVRSSDAARCVATVRPFAHLQHATIDQEPIFSETGFERRPAAAADRFEALLADGRPTVLCTHRPVLPSLMESAARRCSGPTRQLVRAVLSQGLSPGAFVVLHRTAGPDPRIVAAEHTKPKKADHDARHSLST